MGAKNPHLSTIFSPPFEKTQVVSHFLTHAVRRFRLGAIPETGLFGECLVALKAGLLRREGLITCMFRKDSPLSKHFANPQIIGYH